MKTLLLDMDGVIADWHRAAVELCGLTWEQVVKANPHLPWPYAIEKQISMTTGVAIDNDELWRRIDLDPGFWLDIKPTPWLGELWDCIKECRYNVVISSNPHILPRNVAHKISWLRTHLPDLHERAWMFGKNKHLMAKKGNVLLDDCEENCREFKEHGGEVILFPRPWNSHFYLTETRSLTLVKEMLKRLSV